MSFITNAAGESFWDCPDGGDRHLRVVLNPDEGSALFSGYEFLCQQSAAVALRRDELWLGLEG